MKGIVITKALGDLVSKEVLTKLGAGLAVVGLGSGIIYTMNKSKKLNEQIEELRNEIESDKVDMCRTLTDEDVYAKLNELKKELEQELINTKENKKESIPVQEIKDIITSFTKLKKEIDIRLLKINTIIESNSNINEENELLKANINKLNKEIKYKDSLLNLEKEIENLKESEENIVVELNAEEKSKVEKIIDVIKEESINKKDVSNIVIDILEKDLVASKDPNIIKLRSNKQFKQLKGKLISAINNGKDTLTVINFANNLIRNDYSKEFALEQVKYIYTTLIINNRLTTKDLLKEIKELNLKYLNINKAKEENSATLEEDNKEELNIDISDNNETIIEDKNKKEDISFNLETPTTPLSNLNKSKLYDPLIKVLKSFNISDIDMNRLMASNKLVLEGKDYSTTINFKEKDIILNEREYDVLYANGKRKNNKLKAYCRIFILDKNNNRILKVFNSTNDYNKFKNMNK